MSVQPSTSGSLKEDKDEQSGSGVTDIVLVDKKELDSMKKTLDEERERLRDLENKLLYLRADFENYRRRMEMFMQEQATAVNERLISEILDIADELELALRAGEGLKEPNQLLGGVRMTLGKLYQLLEKNGVRRISSTGSEFDPRLHQAVERVPSDELPEGRVVEELRSGFMLGNKVLRPSLVKVSYRPNQSPATGEVV
jgi:molecular chaperone GrpE